MQMSSNAVFLNISSLGSMHFFVFYATRYASRTSARGCLGSTCISPVWLERGIVLSPRTTSLELLLSLSQCGRGTRPNNDRWRILDNDELKL